jgi:hypothetical protein
MSNNNTASILLKTHLENIKAETLAWVAESPDTRYAMYPTTDLAHWAEAGINTIAEYIREDIISDHYETYKEVNGIRCRWMDYKSMSNEEIQQETELLYREAQCESKYAILYAQIDAENEQYQALMLTPAPPTKYDNMALRAGYAA